MLHYVEIIIKSIVKNINRRYNLIGDVMDIFNLSKIELSELIKENQFLLDEKIASKAYELKYKYYKNTVYARGLIEFTNICKNNCYYCGIRAENKNIKRYRLSKEEILSCCENGYNLGFSTFVLQGGEDMYFNDKIMCDIIYSIKEKYHECAVTLSIGEKSKESYKQYKDAGADRFLLRHETANDEHYSMLHPDNLTLKNRRKCLYNLKDLGYQVGAGFMVGSPYQTFDNLAEDLLFLKELKPDMIGIGPFLSHHDTPFKDCKNGTVDLTITMLALARIMVPDCLLPATTALATLAPQNGRIRAFRVGANVVMPNLSPIEHRKEYSLYDNKLSSGNEAAESIKILKSEIEKADCVLDMSRGDNVKFK